MCKPGTLLFSKTTLSGKVRYAFDFRSDVTSLMLECNTRDGVRAVTRPLTGDVKTTTATTEKLSKYGPTTKLTRIISRTDYTYSSGKLVQIGYGTL